MHLGHLAVIAALVFAAATGPNVARAQDNTQQMLALAKQLRAQAEQMKGSLPPDQIQEMLHSADEIERDAKAGGFNAPPPPEAGAAARIANAHNGRLDWLDGEPACVGYGWENYKTFHLKSGDRDAERDVLCKGAYAHYAEYMRVVVNGGGSVRGDPLLIAYDKAAQKAVDFYERR